MISFLVDDRGKVWPGSSHPRIDAGAPDELAFAVFDLGFVHLRAQGTSLTTVFNPYRNSAFSRTGAYFVISDLVLELGIERLILVYGDGADRKIEICQAVGAIERIAEICERRGAAVRPSLTWRRVSPQKTSGSHRDQLFAMLRLWGEFGGIWSAERRVAVDDQGLLGSAAIIRNPAGSRQLLIEHWGARRNMLGERWLQRAGGRHVEDQPFPELAARVAALYRRTLAAGRPRLHEVDTVIPTADGRLLRRQYNRLLLPYSSATRDRYILALNFFANEQDA